MRSVRPRIVLPCVLWGAWLSAWGAAVAPAAPLTWAARTPPAAQAGAERGGLLPDLRVVQPHDLVVVGSRAEGDLRLKFTTVIWNDGQGPIEVQGAVREETGELEVFQYLHFEDGTVRRDRPVGTFDYEHRHGHLHLSSFARYELWSLDAEGRAEALVAENAKVGFCLMDNLVVDEPRAEGDASYGGCEAEVQGISVGYGDEYLADLYEQDLNISHLEGGRYRLVNIANPDEVLREARYDNNAASVDIRLRDDRVTLLEAR